MHAVCCRREVWLGKIVFNGHFLHSSGEGIGLMSSTCLDLMNIFTRPNILFIRPAVKFLLDLELSDFEVTGNKVADSEVTLGNNIADSEVSSGNKVTDSDSVANLGLKAPGLEWLVSTSLSKVSVSTLSSPIPSSDTSRLSTGDGGCVLSSAKQEGSAV